MNTEDQMRIISYCENQNFDEVKRYILNKNILKRDFGWLYHYLFSINYEDIIHWLFDRISNIDLEKELIYAKQRDDKELILFLSCSLQNTKK